MSEAPAVYATGDVPVFADDMLLSIAIPAVQMTLFRRYQTIHIAN